MVYNILKFSCWTMVQLNPGPVYPPVSVHCQPRPVHLQLRDTYSWYRAGLEEYSNNTGRLSPDDFAEGGGDWFKRIHLESPIKMVSQTGVAKKKKKKYEPKARLPVSTGGVNERGFGPPH